MALYFICSDLTGNFMDLRVAVLIVHDQGVYSVTVRSPITGKSLVH